MKPFVKPAPFVPPADYLVPRDPELKPGYLSNPNDDPYQRFHSWALEEVRAEALWYAKNNPGDGAKSARYFAANCETLAQVDSSRNDYPLDDTSALDDAVNPIRFINRAPYPLPALSNDHETVPGWAFQGHNDARGTLGVQVSDLLDVARDMLARDIRSGVGVVKFAVSA